ncbi:coiled-coil protein [Legionella sainthelensi]|uniref:Coiled-coil protein n=1 Tax=Legionella sainthelensi TaxID=28087 RepID=A0A0W0YBD2_9GAMM|nr:hypothetical protein [Legionella sainthelensi]KTD54167.1 coiled-coil protein [Legionella sainthelensi]VEH29620.1 coiled-coil protein [Legionella sainthelensi]
MREKNETAAYLQALKANPIDSSDFILLTTALLKKELGGKVRQEVDEIMTHYLHLEKDKAILAIEKICETHREISENHLLSTTIVEAKKHVTDNPIENQSRRYFETRFATNLFESMEEESPVFYDGMQKLSDLVKELNPGLYDKDIGKGKDDVAITTMEGAKSVVGTIRELGDTTPDFTLKRNAVRRNSPAAYKTKDRLNEPVRGTNEENNVFSQNPGIMKSIHAMPFNERTSEEQNRIVDSYALNPAVKDGYSATKTHVPFVNSVSGTAFSTVTLAGAFIEKHPQDPDLQEHVDNIVLTFVARAVNEGFHSLREIMDVFKEPAVQKVINDHKLELRIKYPPEVLNKSFQEAVQYSTKVCLGRCVKDELQNIHEHTGKPEVSEKGKPHKPPFPTELGIRENKVTGPRVEEALREMAKNNPQQALESAQRFLAWKNYHHRNFNVKGIKELVGELKPKNSLLDSFKKMKDVLQTTKKEEMINTDSTRQDMNKTF